MSTKVTIGVPEMSKETLDTLKRCLADECLELHCLTNFTDEIALRILLAYGLVATSPALILRAQAKSVRVTLTLPQWLLLSLQEKAEEIGVPPQQCGAAAISFGGECVLADAQLKRVNKKVECVECGTYFPITHLCEDSNACFGCTYPSS